MPSGITEEELVWYLMLMGSAGAIVAFVIGLLWRRR
jgi:hypothetical protein